MFELLLLGPVELTGRDGGPVLSVLKQPKRVALLAFVATGPSGSRTREEILDLFWPDPDRSRGRHALSQALYYLRRSLGRDTVRSEGEALSLHPDRIRTDVAAFRAAIDGGHLEEALELVRGPLLQGLVLDADPPVARWLDRERDRMAGIALQAAEDLSTRARAAGDLQGAVAWAERGVALAPLRERPMRHLLETLVLAAEPVRARTTLERFRRRLRDELGMDPSPETCAVVDRAATPGPDRTAGSEAAPPPPTSADDESSGRTDEAEPVGPGPGGRSPPRRPRGAWVWAVPTLAVVLTALTTWWARAPASRPIPPEAEASDTRRRVAVFPFAYRGHPELQYLGEGIPELLTISLGGLEQVSVVDPRALARRAGAGPTDSQARPIALDYGAQHFVVGSVLEAGGQIQVTAHLHGGGDAPVLTLSERAASEEDIFVLVDDMVRRLVASDALPVATQLERAAALTTSSLPALRHFLRGEGLFRAGHFPDAVSAFDRAAREDTAFAVALYRGAVASLWSDQADFDAARRRLERARAHRERVAELEGTLIEALDAFLDGDLPRAEVLYGSVLARQPENLEAWFQLGEARFHYGALYGRTAAASESAWRHVLALAPDHRAALIHLSALVARAGDPGLDSLGARLAAQGDGSVPAPQIRALRLLSQGADLEGIGFLDGLAGQPGGAISSTASYVARYRRDLDAATAMARLLTRDTRPTSDRLEGHLLLAHLETARGRAAAAREALDHARDLDPEAAELHGLLLAAIPPVRLGGGGEAPVLDLSVPLPAGRTAPGLETFDGSIPSGLLTYGRALAYARSGGEAGALLATARRLREGRSGEGDPFLDVLGGALIAEERRNRGDAAAARAELGTALGRTFRWYEHLRESWIRALARERFLLAELESRGGDPVRATALLESMAENSVAEMPYLGPSLVRLGELREAEGDTIAALAAYRSALELWRDADRGLRAVQEVLRSRIEDLEGLRVTSARAPFPASRGTEVAAVR